MDMPIFHLDFLNNRMLIAIIAILHVVINHSMAVGGIPLVAYLEWKSLKTGNEAWNALAYRVLSTFFIVTTTVGAMTGVGIWLSAALVNPYAIGSLLRVFFWTWFTEWLVFVAEVVLIMTYYLTWKRWVGERKRAHVKLGFGLALASWATMALIVSILAFMMDPGAWRSDRTLFSGMFNPVYLPQLAFRTPLAMVMAGAAALPIVLRATDTGSTARSEAVRAVSRWMLVWTVPCALGGYWYARVIPSAMGANVPVALLTQALASWAHVATYVLAGAAAGIAVVAAWGAYRPRSVPRPVLLVPALLAIMLIGTFERVREFVRKPYAIADYLYSNGIRKDDYAILQRDGLLAHATYTSVRTITAENELEAGREVFSLACTRCHTVDGVNGMRGILTTMYGDSSKWDAGAVSGYIGIMHNARPFMPPFPGSVRERDALAAYLVNLQNHRDTIDGAQATGVVALPKPPAKTSAVSLDGPR